MLFELDKIFIEVNIKPSEKLKRQRKGKRRNPVADCSHSFYCKKAAYPVKRMKIIYLVIFGKLVLAEFVPAKAGNGNPAQSGIQTFINALDSRFRGSDYFFKNHPI
jgi:hypothetical protein